MLSAACRIVAGFAVWCISISPAGAQSSGIDRKIEEHVTYHFGRHLFLERGRITGLQDLLPDTDRDIELLPRVESCAIDAETSTDALSSDFLSDAQE